MKQTHLILLIALVCPVHAQGLRAGEPKSVKTTDWPQWRGPAANGVADGRNLSIQWSTTKNVIWRVKLPGWGTSSPVVFGDRVFVTSEGEEKGKKSLLTLCYDRANGKEVWRREGPERALIILIYRRTSHTVAEPR